VSQVSGCGIERIWGRKAKRRRPSFFQKRRPFFLLLDFGAGILRVSYASANDGVEALGVGWHGASPADIGGGVHTL
jgi:hypothetical protein